MNLTLSVAMFVAGVILLVCGVLREFRFLNLGPLTKRQQGLFIGLGAVLMLLALFVERSQTQPVYQAVGTYPSSPPPTGPAPAPAKPPESAKLPDPQTLIATVKTEQLRAVRESYGENNGECFTDVDLTDFKANRVPEQVVATLRRNTQFIDVVLAIKALPSSEREDLLAAARAQRRKTWKELGRVSRDGQTEAGRQAETLIALAIVAEVQRLLQLSTDDIKRLAT